MRKKIRKLKFQSRKLLALAFLLFTFSVQASPQFRSATSGTASTGAPTATLPTGHALNDILFLIIETSNQSISAPAGYTEVASSPQGTGTGGAVNSCGLQVFWKRDNGSEAAPTIPDSGDHTVACMMAFSGCLTTGTPFAYTNGGVISATQTNPSFTTSSNVLIKGGTVVAILANGFDSSSVLMTAPTITAGGNSVIGAVGTVGRPTVQFATGTGGGVRSVDATYDDVNATGTYSYGGTYASATLYAGITIVLMPIAATNNFLDLF